eukprot:1862555-Pyramimonas_sp.AAC.1
MPSLFVYSLSSYCAVCLCSFPCSSAAASTPTPSAFHPFSRGSYSRCPPSSPQIERQIAAYKAYSLDDLLLNYTVSTTATS